MAESYSFKGVVKCDTYETYVKAMKKGMIQPGQMVVIEKSGSSLPTVSEEDNGKVLKVVDGNWEAADLPTYEGDYSVTPSATAQSLATAGKTMTNDITVEEIPYYEVNNVEGGTTVNIG